MSEHVNGPSTGAVSRRLALQYAAVLTGGLILFIPLLNWAASTLFAAPTTYTVAAGISVVGAAYIVLMARTRTFVPGVFVALIVLSTFSADVPLATVRALGRYPGSVGPYLWLLEGPLLLLIGYFLFYRRDSISDSSIVEYLLGGVVVWVVVSALLSPPMRMDTVLFFALNLVIGLFAFAVSMRAVRENIIGYETVLLTFCIVVSGQSFFALLQTVTGGSFQLSILGDTALRRVSPTTYELFGFTNQVIPGGFTGYGYILGSLILLSAPVVLVYAIRTEGRKRMLLLANFGLMVAVLRLTSSDSLRGAAILTIASALVGTYWLVSGETGNRLQDSVRNLRERAVMFTVTVLFSVFVVFFPASRVIGTTETSSDTAAQGNGSNTVSASPGETTGDTTAQMTSTATSSGNTPQAPSSASGGQATQGMAGLELRLDQYRGGLRAFAEHPVFGVGAGNFQYVSTEYGPEAIRKMSVHNIYIGLLAETGLPGFVLYVGAIVGVLYAGWYLLRADSQNAVLHVALLSGLVGYLAFAFWTHTPIDRITSFVPFWIIAGLVVGRSQKIRTEW